MKLFIFIIPVHPGDGKIPAAAERAVNHIYPANPSDNGIEKSESLCCGLGGGLNSVSPEMADCFLTI